MDLKIHPCLICQKERGKSIKCLYIGFLAQEGRCTNALTSVLSDLDEDEKELEDTSLSL